MCWNMVAERDENRKGHKVLHFSSTHTHTLSVSNIDVSERAKLKNGKKEEIEEWKEETEERL